MATEQATIWIPWVRWMNRPQQWKALLKYEFVDEIACLKWLAENFPALHIDDTEDQTAISETIALPAGTRPHSR